MTLPLLIAVGLSCSAGGRGAHLREEPSPPAKIRYPSDLPIISFDEFDLTGHPLLAGLDSLDVRTSAHEIHVPIPSAEAIRRTVRAEMMSGVFIGSSHLNIDVPTVYCQHPVGIRPGVISRAEVDLEAEVKIPQLVLPAPLPSADLSSKWADYVERVINHEKGHVAIWWIVKEDLSLLLNSGGVPCEQSAMDAALAQTSQLTASWDTVYEECERNGLPFERLEPNCTIDQVLQLVLEQGGPASLMDLRFPK